MNLENSTGKLERSLRKKSKITFWDKLANVGKNIIEDPLAVAMPLITAGAICGTVFLGVDFSKTKKINEGYVQAHNQVEGISTLLNSNKEFWQDPPLSPRVFQSVKDSLYLSLSRQNSKEGQELSALVSKVEEAIYSPNIDIKRKEDLMRQLSDGISPLSQRPDQLLGFTILLGLASFIPGLFSFAFLKDYRFTDYNIGKKKLRENYLNFIEKIETAKKSGDLSEETIGYMGKFFRGLDLLNADDLGIVLSDFSSSLNNRSKDLLKILAEHPIQYAQGIDSISSIYDKFVTEDESNPHKESRLKSRKDLFLKLLVRETNYAEKIKDAINLVITLEGEAPSLLEALINGTRTSSEVLRAGKFLSAFAPINKEKAVSLIDYYLTHSDSPKLPERELGDEFGSYIGRKMNYLSPGESLTLISSLENLKAAINEKTQSYPKAFWMDGNGDWIVETALATFKKNSQIGVHVFSDAKKLSKIDPSEREAYQTIYLEGFVPTEYLVDRLIKSKDRSTELMKWEMVKREIARGGFDPSDPLKMNIEYTHYCLEAAKIGAQDNFESYKSALKEAKNG